MRKTVNEVYENFSNGIISLKKAENEIIECIFRAPTKFGLYSMSDDERSEFIIYIIERIHNIMINYRNSLSTFSTYLTMVLLNYKKTWYRKYYHKRAKAESVKYYYNKEMELILCEDELPYDSLNTIDAQNNMYSKSDAQAILVLALKSCYYLSQRHISLLSLKTGYSENYLYSLKEELEKLIENKINRSVQKREQLNSTFIKRNSCKFELTYMDKNTSLAQQLKKNYLFYTKYWKKNIVKCNNVTPVRPSNSQIAKVLNMKEHIVYKLLNDVKKLNTEQVVI